MARYRDAVDWIAANEETAIITVEGMEDDVCVALVADLFRKEPSMVAAHVIARREELFRVSNPTFSTTTAAPEDDE